MVDGNEEIYVGAVVYVLCAYSVFGGNHSDRADCFFQLLNSCISQPISNMFKDIHVILYHNSMAHCN